MKFLVTRVYCGAVVKHAGVIVLCDGLASAIDYCKRKAQGDAYIHVRSLATHGDWQYEVAK
jgi:hypothetical protein